MADAEEYTLVRLRGGACSVHARSYAETMHPGIGPVAEAEALYVEQTGLIDRLRGHVGEFVIWDVGMGVAANALTVLRRTQGQASQLRILSFDHTVEPLAFALRHADDLPHLDGFRDEASRLMGQREVAFVRGVQRVDWRLVVGDFPTLIQLAEADAWPAPHLILFDPYSPARNPAMWTLPVMAGMHRRLDAGRPCLLSTYSRSTLTRVTLLLAGFWVGVGRPTGLKEETTVAANTPALVGRLLDWRWLERARRSDSAEPLLAPVHRKAALAPETWARLQRHPQFASGPAPNQPAA